MRVLSLFDGISGTQQALKNLGITPEIYFASEIDKYAIKITQKNFPDTVQLGDVTKLHDFDFGEIDLMTWGSPCQDLSIAKKDRAGLKGERSGLFWDAIKIWKRVNPKYWIMENVASMPKEDMHIISRELGVYPILINSALVTAQQRNRYYWTNIKGNMLDGSIEQPEDRGILLCDVLEKNVDKKYITNTNFDIRHDYKINTFPYKNKAIGLRATDYKGTHNVICEPQRIGQINSGAQGNRIYSENGKSVSISAVGGGQGAKTGLYVCKIDKKGNPKSNQKKSGCLTGGAHSGGNHSDMDLLVFDENKKYIVRRLIPIECERLQGYPDDYTKGISNTQRYKSLGNSFTVPVIEHILNKVIK